MGLAVAEAACGFEHRDLHWGNVLLRRDPGCARTTCQLRCGAPPPRVCSMAEVFRPSASKASSHG